MLDIKNECILFVCFKHLVIITINDFCAIIPILPIYGTITSSYESLRNTLEVKMMDTRLLKYFESIARNKNITRAASELHISQPSLSKQMKMFEQELDCKLFKRNTREITLTDAGKVLYKHSVQILQQLKNATKEMEDVKNVGLGEISIGAYVTSIPWLCEIIPEFKRRYPHIPIKIKEMGAEEIAESLKQYDVHIGITSNCQDTDVLKFTPVFEEPLVLITPLHHHLSNREEISFTDLDGEPLIFFPSNYHTRQITMAAFNQNDIKPNIAFETSRTSSIISLVASELGSALIFESHLNSQTEKNINIIQVNNPMIKRTLYTAIHHDRNLPSIIHELNSLISQFFISNQTSPE